MGLEVPALEKIQFSFANLTVGLELFLLPSSPGEELFLTLANYFPFCSTSVLEEERKSLARKRQRKGLELHSLKLRS